MINCKEIFDLLSDFIDEELEIDFEEEIREHINECVRCRYIANTFKKTIDLFREIEILEVPEEIHEQLIQVIELEINEDIEDF